MRSSPLRSSQEAHSVRLVPPRAPGEMLRRRGGHRHVAPAPLFPAVHLLDAVGGHAPFTQPRTDAERHEVAAHAVLQRRDRRHVEVVVVVVRQHHALDGRQFFQRKRRCVKAFRPEPREGRGARPEHRVDQPELAAQLEQVRRVAQAHDVVGRRVQGGQRRGIQLAHRHRVQRHGAFLALEQEARPDVPARSVRLRMGVGWVLEFAGVGPELRRLEKAGLAVLRLGAQRHAGGQQRQQRQQRQRPPAGDSSSHGAPLDAWRRIAVSRAQRVRRPAPPRRGSPPPAFWGAGWPTFRRTWS